TSTSYRRYCREKSRYNCPRFEGDSNRSIQHGRGVGQQAPRSHSGNYGETGGPPSRFCKRGAAICKVRGCYRSVAKTAADDSQSLFHEGRRREEALRESRECNGGFSSKDCRP